MPFVQGGTNFRVLRVELNEDQPDQVRIKNYVIDPAHMQVRAPLKEYLRK